MSHVESTNKLICGNGYGSFGQALIRFVKSTYNCHFPFFFFTSTMFANQSGWWTSTMNWVSLSLSISTFMILLRLVSQFYLHWIIGLAIGSRWRRWQIIERSILNMSSSDHAKTLVNSSFSLSVNFKPILAFLSGMLVSS